MPASLAASDQNVKHWLISLERAEIARTGDNPGDVRDRIADRIGILKGTAENIRRGRTKGVRAWVAERLYSAFIKEITKEIARL